MLAQPVEGLPAEGLRERNRRRRVGRILSAARGLLRDRPEDGLTVERIAARAEVSPATVFNLVGTRDRIWAALADETLAEIDARIAGLREPDPYRRARRVVTTAARVVCADPVVHRAVLSHWRESGHLLRRGPVDQLADCLRDAADLGVLRPDLDPRRLAQVVSVGCTGAVHQWAAGVIDDRRLAERCRAIVDIVFAAGAAHGRAGEFLAPFRRSGARGRAPAH
jgi:AcrR family transcriptional regulator